MTTLVGYHDGYDRVWIGADTRLSSEATLLGSASKLIVWGTGKEQHCMAVGGHRTSYHALHACLQESQYLWDTTAHVYDSVVALHHEMREHHGLLSQESGDEFESSQYSALIGNHLGLWSILSSREVIQSKGFVALGSGRGYALGSLHGAVEYKNPVQSMKNALSAAHAYDKSTGLEKEIWTNVP